MKKDAVPLFYNNKIKCTMKRSLVVLLFITVNCTGQNRDGIHFDTLLNWNQIREQARLENKYIFIDVYTTWCLPCKFMSEKIFSQSKVGDFFNKHFMNVAVQANTTDADSERVKQWYAVADTIVNQYKVDSYPTYLFLNPEGKLVHVLTGATGDADLFIAKALKALDPLSQMAILKRRFMKGERDTAFLQTLIQVCTDANDSAAPRYMNAYLALQDDLLTPGNISLLVKATRHSTDIGFPLLIEYAGKLKPFIGAEQRRNLLNKIAFDEEIFPVIMLNGKITEYGGGMTVYGGGKMNTNVDWTTLQRKVQGRYADISDFILLNGKLKYFLWTKDWAEFNRILTTYVAEPKNVDTNFVDMMASKLMWECEEADALKGALPWAVLLTSNQQKPWYFETYSKLLYRAGETKQAIVWMERYITLSRTPDELARQTLSKMKNGESIE